MARARKVRRRTRSKHDRDIQRLQVAASWEVTQGVILKGLRDVDRELRLDRQVRGVHKALGDGWSDHTARRRRDIIGVYAESIDRAALGITGHGGEKKGGKRKRTQTKRYPAPRYGETDW